MPEKNTKRPRYLRAAMDAYGGMLGGRGRALEAEMASWDDDELFIVAHLSYCQLLQGEEIRRQNDTIIGLLKDIAEDTNDIADIAEEMDGDDNDDDIEESDDSDDSDEDIEAADDIEADDGSSDAEVIEMPAPAAPAAPPAKGAAMFDHPEPDGAA